MWKILKKDIDLWHPHIPTLQFKSSSTFTIPQTCLFVDGLVCKASQGRLTTLGRLHLSAEISCAFHVIYTKLASPHFSILYSFRVEKTSSGFMKHVEKRPENKVGLNWKNAFCATSIDQKWCKRDDFGTIWMWALKTVDRIWVQYLDKFSSTQVEW